MLFFSSCFFVHENYAKSENRLLRNEYDDVFECSKVGSSAKFGEFENDDYSNLF